ncbi:MAG: YigZ family protein [Bacteroidetes bacterium]|nr:YigZ family protein [Bacteroidota bacterium]
MNSTPDSYFTIASPANSVYKEKGSKFIAYTFSVKSEEEVKEHILKIKKEHFSARHVCYACRLGPMGEHTRTSDAGEPANTAGKPILNQIISRNITQALVIVVRYFGGTLLGTHGLINAYRSAAAETLDKSSVTEKLITDTFKILFDYEAMNDVMQIIKEYETEQVDPVYDIQCTITINVRKKNSKAIKEKLLKIKGVQVQEMRLCGTTFTF